MSDIGWGYENILVAIPVKVSIGDGVGAVEAASSAPQLGVVGAQHRSAEVRRTSEARTAAPAEAVEVGAPAAVEDAGTCGGAGVRWGAGRRASPPELQPPRATANSTPA